MGWLREKKPLEIQREVKTPVVDLPPAAVENEETLPMAKPADIFSIINLPKVELEKYHCFIKLFEECVKTADDTIKLTRLLQYKSGKAHVSIRSCILMDDGYNRAREILSEIRG